MQVGEEAKAAIKRSTLTDWLLVLFTFVLAGSAIYQFIIMSGQLGTMQQQVSQSDRQFAISHRPWVGIKSLDKVSPLVFDMDGVHTKADFTVKNGGSSPAINVINQGHLVVKTYVSIDMNPLDRLRNDAGFICAPDLALALHTNQIGLFLLPGEEQPFPSAELAAKKQDIPVGDLVQVYWVGCMGYSDDSNIQHGTSFVYQFITISGAKTFPPNGTVDGNFTNFGLSKAY